MRGARRVWSYCHCGSVRTGCRRPGGIVKLGFLHVEYWMLEGYCGQSRAEQSRAEQSDGETVGRGEEAVARIEKQASSRHSGGRGVGCLVIVSEIEMGLGL